MPAPTRMTAGFAGALALAGALAFSASAAADPPEEPPADPAAPTAPPGEVLPPPSTIGTTLAQNGAPGGPGGLPDISAYGNALTLAQNPAPAAPGSAAATPPNLYAFNNQYLLPQNLKPSAPGQGEIFGVPPGEENGNTTFLGYLKRLHSAYQQGGLKGGLLGQMPQEQLGEPLPGTAPPPGANIPVGLGQNLPDIPQPPAP